MGERRKGGRKEKLGREGRESRVKFSSKLLKSFQKNIQINEFMCGNPYKYVFSISK